MSTVHRCAIILLSVLLSSLFFVFPAALYAQVGGADLPRPGNTAPETGVTPVEPGGVPSASLSPLTDTITGSGVDAGACMAAATNFEIFIAVVDVLMLAIAAGVILFLSKRGIGTHTSRWLWTAVVFAGAGTGLIGWNPMATDAFVECVTKTDLASFIPLGTLNPWIAGVIVGFVPIFLVYSLLIVILNKTGVL